MQIHVDRGGERYGPYGLEEVNAYLSNGTLLPTDQAWQDGMAGWVPIGQIPGVTTGSTTPDTPALVPVGKQAVQKVSTWKKISDWLKQCVVWFKQGTREAAHFAEVEQRAEAGDTDAQWRLGVMYAKGEGCSHDLVEAVNWFSIAAEKGQVEAQFFLGESYRQGWGVEKDYEEAKNWYSLAAFQGFFPAQSNLGLMLFQPEYMLEDYSAAYAWLVVAVSNGDTDAEIILEETLIPLMTTNQLKEANIFFDELSEVLKE
jgi:hypothetical protein